ncbi:MAG: phage coat protein [Oscillospiraceae bacterium]|nr:phage coat protein [Oscillospiraceae bacterium]
MASIFDSKIWNPQVFDRYRETIPLIRTNALLTSGAFKKRADWPTMFPAQAGGNRITTPFTGRLDGEADNYNGVNDMTIDTIGTYQRDIIAIGRMKGWEEKDFTSSITGKDFMPEIAQQVNEWYDNENVGDVLAITNGIFSMPLDDGDTPPVPTINAPFVTSHTHDISGLSGDLSKFSETTIITAAQKACGMNMNVFSIAYMHSFIVANLTKIMQVEYMKFTDINGFTKDVPMATVNGKAVLMDDRLYNPTTGNYTSYILGVGAFDYADLPVQTPSSTSRDEITNGGISMLHTRQRKVFAPNGISYTMESQATLSPTRSELALGENWEIVLNQDKSKTIDIKSIPISRIISKG